MNDASLNAVQKVNWLRLGRILRPVGICLVLFIFIFPVFAIILISFQGSSGCAELAAEVIVPPDLGELSQHLFTLSFCGLSSQQSGGDDLCDRIVSRSGAACGICSQPIPDAAKRESGTLVSLFARFTANRGRHPIFYPTEKRTAFGQSDRSNPGLPDIQRSLCNLGESRFLSRGGNRNSGRGVS
jgi:hypothetical protein